MERAARSVSSQAESPLVDGLGERRLAADPAGATTLEQLCLRADLATVPSFEFALRERVARLAPFRHPSFARVRSVERVGDNAALAVVSERAQGMRLSQLLRRTEDHQISLDIETALAIIRQLVPAIAALHQAGPDGALAHGAIAPERLVVTRTGTLIVVEHVLGAALEQLRFSPERYWTELRVAVPRSTGTPRFDHRLDVTQIGVVSLSLILGRLLRDDEYPGRVAEVLASTWAVSPRGGFEPLPSGLRGWLGRALQMDPQTGFASAADALRELDVVAKGGDLAQSAAAVQAFLARHFRDVAAATAPAAPPAAAAPAASRPAPVVTAPAPPPPAPAPRVAPKVPAPAPPPPQAVIPAPAPVAAPPPPAAPVRMPAVTLTSIKEATRPPETPAPQMFETDSAAPKRRGMSLAAAAVLIAVVGGGAFAARSYFAGAAAPEATGTLVVNTAPAGVEAFVDGQPRGRTPLSISLTPGPHRLELRGAGEPRTIPIMIAAGTQISQYVELATTAAAAAGQLQVRTEPAGAQVTVDDIPRGVSPLVIADLAPGEHTVVLASDLGNLRQTVTIESGVTSSLVVPLTPSANAPVSGWVSVSAPVEMELFEGGKLVGTSQSDRIMVSAGRHELEIVNNTLGYRSTRVVQVPAGRVAPIKIDLPMGTIALNALPWAEVWIDGERIGETPIGNLPIPIGPHEIVFRHPQFGELRHAATVTLTSPARISVDLRQQR